MLFYWNENWDFIKTDNLQVVTQMWITQVLQVFQKMIEIFPDASEVEGFVMDFEVGR